MYLSNLSDTIQELCHEGKSMTAVKFSYQGKPLVLRSIKTDNTQTVIELQDELNSPAHQGFLNIIK